MVYRYRGKSAPSKAQIPASRAPPAPPLPLEKVAEKVPPRTSSELGAKTHAKKRRSRSRERETKTVRHGADSNTYRNSSDRVSPNKSEGRDVDEPIRARTLDSKNVPVHDDDKRKTSRFDQSERKTSRTDSSFDRERSREFKAAPNKDHDRGHRPPKSSSRFDRRDSPPPAAAAVFETSPGVAKGETQEEDSASTSLAVMAALSKARDIASRPPSLADPKGAAVDPVAAAAAAVSAADYMSAGWVAKENSSQPKRRRGAIPKPLNAATTTAQSPTSATVSAPSEESLLTNDGGFLELAKRKIAMGPPAAVAAAATPKAVSVDASTPGQAYTGFYNGLSGYASDNYLQQQQQQQYFLQQQQQQQQQAYLLQQQQEQFYAAQTAQSTDPAAYYSAFWEYFAAYGEDLARQYYGEASPPQGTAPPDGVVDPTKSAGTTTTVADDTTEVGPTIASENKDCTAGSDNLKGVTDTSSPSGMSSAATVESSQATLKVAEQTEQTGDNLEDASQLPESLNGTEESNQVQPHAETSESALSREAAAPSPSLPDSAAASAPAAAPAHSGPVEEGSDNSSAALQQQWADYYAAQQQQQQQQQAFAVVAPAAPGYSSGGYTAADPNSSMAYTDAYSSQYEAYFNHYKQAFSTQVEGEPASAAPAEVAFMVPADAGVDTEVASSSLASELAEAYYSATLNSTGPAAPP